MTFAKARMTEMEKSNKHPIVSSHAIDKFLSETGCKNSRSYAEKRILKMYDKSEQVYLPQDISTTRLLRNGINEATYYEYAQWRMVVVNGIMVTFERKFKKRK